jgi:hypothetical protein
MVVVGKTVTVLEEVIVVGVTVDVWDVMVVGKTVTELEDVEVVVVEVVVVVVKGRVLVRVLVVGEDVKKCVEKEEWLLVVEKENAVEDPKENVSVWPLSTLEWQCSDEDLEGVRHEGDLEELSHDAGFLGSHPEVPPLNQLRSLATGSGPSSS